MLAAEHPGRLGKNAGSGGEERERDRRGRARDVLHARQKAELRRGDLFLHARAVAFEDGGRERVVFVERLDTEANRDVRLTDEEPGAELGVAPDDAARAEDG